MWGSDWSHGDALLFIVSSAQIMYAYVMRPDTLPTDYHRFIVKSGPIPSVALEATRRANRGLPQDLPRLFEYAFKRGGDAAVAALRSSGVNPPRCTLLHPHTNRCTIAVATATADTFRKTLPLYLSLNLVPTVVLKFNKFLRFPCQLLVRALANGVRSTCFLSSFVGLYQATVCVHKAAFLWDHKVVYWAAGVVASLAILIEQKSRRSELALYALPRAVDSVFLTMLDHHLLLRVPHGELLLFCCSLGLCMYFYEHEREVMSPVLRSALSRFLDEHKFMPYVPSVVNFQAPDSSKDV